MGWSHFLGGRPAGPNQGTDHSRDAAWNEGLDYSSYEHHRPTYEVYVAALQAVPGKPVMSEDRFRIRRSPYPEKDYSHSARVAACIIQPWRAAWPTSGGSIRS